MFLKLIWSFYHRAYHQTRLPKKKLWKMQLYSIGIWNFNWTFFPGLHWGTGLQNCILTTGIHSIHLYAEEMQPSLQTSVLDILLNSHKRLSALLLTLLVVKANGSGLIWWQRISTLQVLLIINSILKNLYGGFQIKIDWLHASNFTHSKEHVKTTGKFFGFVFRLFGFCCLFLLYFVFVLSKA